VDHFHVGAPGSSEETTLDSERIYEGWLADAMQATWDTATALLAFPTLADQLGERHRIIANDWEAATKSLALLDDRYPSTDEEQAVHLNVPYPDARQLNRWLPLVKLVAGDPSLHRALLPGDRSPRGGHHCLVCHPVYRTLPAWPLRLRGRGHAVEQSGDRLRAGPGD